MSSMSRRLLSREKAAVGGQENPVCQKGPSVLFAGRLPRQRRTKPGNPDLQVPTVDCAKKEEEQQQLMRDSPALFSRTRPTSLSVAQGWRGHHVCIKICSEDCVWEKQLTSAFSPSVLPLFKRGVLCSQAQSEVELASIL